MALYPKRQLLDKFDGKFVLVNLAAKRATQLYKDKAPILVEASPDEHPLTIALEEIATQAVIPVFAEETPTLVGKAERREVLELPGADHIDALISELLGETEEQPEVEIEAETFQELSHSLETPELELEALQEDSDTANFSISELALEEEEMKMEEEEFLESESPEELEE